MSLLLWPVFLPVFKISKTDLFCGFLSFSSPVFLNIRICHPSIVIFYSQILLVRLSPLLWQVFLPVFKISKLAPSCRILCFRLLFYIVSPLPSPVSCNVFYSLNFTCSYVTLMLRVCLPVFKNFENIISNNRIFKPFNYLVSFCLLVFKISEVAAALYG